MIISIEGNIGSGKTTLVNLLKESLINNDKFIFISEPIDIWIKNKDKNGENILTKFYTNQEKYAFPFQIMAYFSRLHLIKNAIKNNPDKIIITERCVNTDRNVFAKMLYEDNKIEDVCYNIYLEWFDEFMDGMNIDKYIYVDSEYSLCHKRINKRNRQGEENIPIEYLKRCELYHKQWLLNNNSLLILDGNQEFENNTDLFNLWKKQILDFI
jgi:deoxyadenosine/deoxycytidine kinase